MSRLGCLLALLIALPALAGPPAAIAPADAGWEKAEASFDRFARGWMKKMERAEASNRAQARPTRLGRGWQLRYRAYGGALRTRLRSTGHAAAPFVGVLSYDEEEMVCENARADRCRIAGTTPVTEIFRYQNGRWVY
ncbi:MAG: hypothetical protein CL910_04795 [Deltaproteobacteria bacterium]|nr:hypothetical protein [Deltaproteobacteria bacterium]